MLGLLVSLVATIAPALPAPAMVATCDVDSPACEALVVRGDDVTPSDYATPAVVDCRSPSSPFGLPTEAFVGECDGTVYDASYRVSRSPERPDEGVTRALRPAPRERRRAVAACDGLPPKGIDLTLSDAQPLVVTTSPGSSVFKARALEPGAVLEELASRFGDPPDRPPRI